MPQPGDSYSTVPPYLNLAKFLGTAVQVPVHVLKGCHDSRAAGRELGLRARSALYVN
eukprot:SAG31_NODE_3137_length_4632_cov_3.575871_1_plen_57_part_00